MRAALYIDCGSIKVEDIPYIYEEIRKTDDLVISKMFGVEMKAASEIAGRLRTTCTAEVIRHRLWSPLRWK